MKEATSIVQFRQPGCVEDPLTEIAREGARRMLATALEAEVDPVRLGIGLDSRTLARQAVLLPNPHMRR